MQIIKLKKVNSTKDYVTKLIKKLSRLREDTVVVSKFMVQGKGIFSKPDPNSLGKVHFSYLRFYTGVKGEKGAQLQKLVGHAILNTLYSLGVKAEINSENNILVGDRKIGDIDIETTLIGDYLDYTIVTVILNANNDLQNGSMPATTIKQITGKDVNLESLIFTLYYNLQNL